LHEGILGPAITFGMMADTVNIIGVVIQGTVRVMFEVVVISGLGSLAGGGMSYPILLSLWLFYTNDSVIAE
jgi:hypothetical protein